MNEKKHTHNSVRSILKTIYRKFWEDWNKQTTTVSLLFGAISILVTILSTPSNDGWSYLRVIRDILIFLIVFLTALWFSFQNLRLQSLLDEKNAHTKKEAAHLSVQIQNLKDVVTHFNNIMFESFSLNSEVEVGALKEDEIKVFEKICLRITQKIKEALTEHFKYKNIDIGDDITLSVKLIIPTKDLADYYRLKISPKDFENLQNKERLIWTVFRDASTYAKQEREISQVGYDIDQNTAFERVIRRGLPSFASDDLFSLWEKDLYRNENDDWQKYYNATLLVPIKYRNNNTDASSDFGILAVDSLNRQGLNLYENNSDCQHMLEHAAVLLSDFFLTLSLFQVCDDLTTPKSE